MVNPTGQSDNRHKKAAKDYGLGCFRLHIIMSVVRGMTGVNRFLRHLIVLLRENLFFQSSLPYWTYQSVIANFFVRDDKKDFSNPSSKGSFNEYFFPSATFTDPCAFYILKSTGLVMLTFLFTGLCKTGSKNFSTNRLIFQHLSF